MLSTLQFILSHPLNRQSKWKAFFRLIYWQVCARVFPYPMVYPFTENSKLLIWKGLEGATGNYYCGLDEFEDMGFLLHLLRPDDLFVDIGANIGSYSILAAAEIGARTISFEPVPSTFQRLSDNIAINHVTHLATPLNMALGNQKGVVHFTTHMDSINHVATPGEQNTIEVPIDLLDTVLAGSSPTLMKIDVEGFETDVIKGGGRTFAQSSLKAVIIELNGSGQRYGYDERWIHDFFVQQGYLPFSYEPFSRQLMPLEVHGKHNTIYIKDLEWVKVRVAEGRKIRVHGQEV